MKKYIKFIIPFSVAAIIILFFAVNISIVQSSADTVILPAGADKGDYTLNDFIQLAVNISKWLLGITGSLALLAFIYGGVVFLISAGNTEMVAKGKKIIFGAIIGLAIVFASYTIIQFTMDALEIKIPGGKTWATSGWFK
ncbi:MAG: hypothetical protein Q8N21_01695 [bacterium]|nr:hypothetical protein [bacterium]